MKKHDSNETVRIESPIEWRERMVHDAIDFAVGVAGIGLVVWALITAYVGD